MLIELLPNWFVANLPVISLLILGVLVERHFVGRMNTFSNSMAVNLTFLRLTPLHWILDWYANIGLIWGIIGALSYLAQRTTSDSNHHLRGWYYAVSWLYSSIVVALVILFAGNINAWLTAG